MPPDHFRPRTLEPPKIEQYAFLAFPKHFWATKCYAYRWYTTFQKSNIAAQKPEVCKPFVVTHLWLTSYLDSSSRAPTKSQRLHPCFRGPAVRCCCRRCHRKSRYTIHIFDVARFNDVLANITAICISGIIRLPVVLATTSLNRATSKT